MKRHSRFLLLLSCLLGTLPVACAGNSVPQGVRRVVFESGNFARPVLATVPRGKSEKELAEFRLWLQNYHGSPPIELPPVPMDGDVDRNDSFVKFLVAKGFIQLEEFSWGTSHLSGGFGNWTKYAHYTPRVEKYIVSRNSLLIADRVLKNITYTNQYKRNPMGMGEQRVFALAFTYTLREICPDFPHVAKVFNGTAVTFQNPNDGHWELEEIRMSDQGANEYMTLVTDLTRKAEKAASTTSESTHSAQTSVNVSVADQAVCRRELKYWPV